MELLQLVDGEGYPVGEAERDECHGNPRLMHLVVHLHVFDPSGNLLLQKRALTKDTYPGLWDVSVGGHVRAGEPVPQALMREAREELGIALDPSEARFLCSIINSSSFETESARCFIVTFAGEHCSGDFGDRRGTVLSDERYRHARRKALARTTSAPLQGPMFSTE